MILFNQSLAKSTVGIAHDELSSSTRSEGYDDDGLVISHAVGHTIESMLQLPAVEATQRGLSIGSSSDEPILAEIETDEEQDVHEQ